MTISQIKIETEVLNTVQLNQLKGGTNTQTAVINSIIIEDIDGV